MDFLQAVPTRDSENQQVVYRTRPAGGVLSQVAGISDSTVQLYFYDIGNIELRIWDSRIEFHRRTGTAAAACWQSLSDCTVGKILLFTADSTYSTVRQYSTAV